MFIRSITLGDVHAEPEGPLVRTAVGHRDGAGCMRQCSTRRHLRELRLENSVVRGEDVRLVPGLHSLYITRCRLVRWQAAHAALAACTGLRRLVITGATLLMSCAPALR